MKNLIFRFLAVVFTVLQFAGCMDFPSSEYDLKLPEAPEIWVSVLGQPHWRLEWLDPGGNKRTADISPGGGKKVELPVTWANPVTAWPYWPGHNLIPGFFKPAGGLFPFDVDGESLILSWKAGLDTVFYWELASAYGQNEKKIPANFDWQRFRELFTSGDLKEDVSKDPWLIDWHFVAEKTMSSSFDRRRLVPEKTQPMTIPVSHGYWYGTSPFAEPLFFPENETPEFQIRSGVNVWFSAEGILRVSDKTWVFTEFK